MIRLNFTISYPWSRRFQNLKVWYGSTPFKYKSWEIEILKTNCIVAVEFHLTYLRDHAGLHIGVGLLGYEIHFRFYDERHLEYTCA
jgi:hypothetical protein